MGTEDGFHQIGAVADRVGLSLRTIRHYEEVGLVIPSGRSGGGYRQYSDADIDRLMQVKAMKPLGFSLEESTELLAALHAVVSGTASSLQLRRLEEFAERAESASDQLESRLRVARAFAASLRRDVGAASVSTSG